MEKVCSKFTSWKDAEAADKAYYRSLTPPQRLDILLEIVASQRVANEDSSRFVRVYRVVKRGGS